MNKQNKIILVVVILIVVLVIAFGVVNSVGKTNNDKNINLTLTSKYDEFAKCLTEKGAVMYGASWCAHCKEQKATLGDSFKYIKYVECPDNTQFCIDKGIEGYPTWLFGTSTNKVEGFDKNSTMQELSKISSCVLPI